MKLLHTSDWHVGKAIRGRSRADEHRSVLAEIASIATAHEVDAIVVAGDLFDSATPTAEAEAIVYRALLDLARTDAHVLVIAGNHDNPRRLAAVAPLLQLGRVHLVAAPARPADGGVRTLDIGGTPLRLALLPFVSHRGIERAEHVMGNAAFENSKAYADRMRALIGAVTEDFQDDGVNVVVAHAFLTGGTIGGGERLAHLIEAYQVSAQAMPATANYVALGHLHRPQTVAGATVIRYCGSPLQMDFGEESQDKSVDVVTLEPGVRTKLESVPLTSGRQLVTVRGAMADLDATHPPNDSWLKVVITGDAPVDAAARVRDLFGTDRVIRIEIERQSRGASSAPRRQGRTPSELFAEYCGEVGVTDHRVANRFAELLDADVDTSLSEAVS